MVPPPPKKAISASPQFSHRPLFRCPLSHYSVAPFAATKIFEQKYLNTYQH